MTDPWVLVAGAVILAIGLGAGVLLGRLSRSYRCGCGHSLAFHLPTSGQCNGVGWQRVTGVERRPGVGVVSAVASDQCGCRQYTGALPRKNEVGTDA